MNRTRFFLVISALLMAYGAFSQPEIRITTNVVYGLADSVELMMDVAMPPTSPVPFPAIVCFHGGGWQQGNKSGQHLAGALKKRRVRHQLVIVKGGGHGFTGTSWTRQPSR